MSGDGIQLRIKGSTFKSDLLELISSVLEAAATTIVTVKTGGASLAVAPNLITGLFGALKSFKREETLEFRAWLLVLGGLLYALEQTIKGTSLKALPSPKDFKRLVDDLAIRVETRAYTIEPSFFSAPTHLGLLDDVAHELHAWVTGFGAQDTISAIKARLEANFAAGLHRTWMKDSDRFEPLEQALNSPFSQSLRRQHEYDSYLQYIEEQFTELRLIGQDEDDPKAVRLAQVFVPLRAYVEQRKNDKEGEQVKAPIELTAPSHDGAGSRTRKRVVRLFETLEEWIASFPSRDAIRIISGGPGIGKSSSMRAFATRVARSGKAYPVLVPLQKLENPERPLRERIRDYLVNTKSISFRESPLELEERPAGSTPMILIFDGLDELVRPGKDADEIAREFMVDLRRLLEEENGQAGGGRARVGAIVTGRIAAAGSAARALKCSGNQVLFLLRFAEDAETVEKDSTDDKGFEDSEGLLKEDQRETWWSLWAAASSGAPKEMPEVLLVHDLFEVTVEPLLLYFIAFVRPWELADEKGIDRNGLYNRLLKEFYDRECTKGGRNFAAEFPSFDEYEVVLQAMALAAWYDGSTRTGTIGAVERLLQDWNEDILGAFKKILGEGKPAVGAALAFYMKPGEAPNSFEFLHKTFAEYLVARRAVEAMECLAADFTESRSPRGTRKRTFNSEAVLADWLRLFGPRPIDFDLLRFLRDEVSGIFKGNRDKVESWRTGIVACIQASLKDGMPAQILFQLRDDLLVRRAQTFREATEQARNAEEALLAAFNATVLPFISDVQFEAIDVRPPRHDHTLFGGMLHRVRGQRVGPRNLLVELLDGLNLAGETLHIQDLYSLRARRANFSGSDLTFANLVLGDLTGAEGVRAEFLWADCEGSNFVGANLERADFEGANLRGANLKDANLKGAKLVGAILEGANLEDVNLEGADLTDAWLEGATLKGARLQDAKVKGTVLERSIAKEVDLEGPERKAVGAIRARRRGKSGGGSRHGKKMGQ